MDNTISETNQQYLRIFESISDGVVVIDVKTNQVVAANPAAAKMHGYDQREFCNLSLSNFINSKNLNSFTDLSNMNLNEGLFETVAQHSRFDNSILHVEWRAVPYIYKGHNCALAVLRDVSDRIKAEQHLKLRLLDRVREQTTLLEISQILTSSLDIGHGLILEQIKVLVEYSHACRFVVGDTNLEMVSLSGIERSKNSLPLRSQIKSKRLIKTLFEKLHPIRINDIWRDDPSAKILRELLITDFAFLLKDVKNWMWVPLVHKEKIISLVGIARKVENKFTDRDAVLAMTIANMAAVALSNAELVEHAKALAVLQERQHLAQNLHDAVNQSLFSAGLIAEVLPRLWERDLDETRRSLEDLRHLIRGAMAEMRALLAELRPTTLTDTELSELLLLLGNAFTGRTNIPVDITVIGEGKLNAETQVALYRICQEGLNNIAKHAKASRVEIQLDQKSSNLVLKIIDNGSGFDISKQVPSGHFGLKMMTERAETVGAKLSISSKRDHGTEIAIHWSAEEENKSG